MNTDFLKYKVLNLAIRGKLVQQDPNDEPAVELIKRIKEEKKRLISENNKKDNKNESFIFRDCNGSWQETIGTSSPKCINDIIPFEVPASWVWCRMGTVGMWGAGSTPSTSKKDYYNGNILWLRTGELNDDVVFDTEIKITEKAFKECSLRLNKVGDVLIAMYGATIGKLAIAGKEMTTNQACCACSPILINNWYLFYYLMSRKRDFIKEGSGGAQPNISRDKSFNAHTSH